VIPSQLAALLVVDKDISAPPHSAYIIYLADTLYAAHRYILAKIGWFLSAHHGHILKYTCNIKI